MKKSWTAGCAPDEAKQITQEYGSAVAFRAKLTDLLQKDLTSKQKRGRSEDLYSSPNWAVQQADVNGYLRALEHVISLIK